MNSGRLVSAGNKFFTSVCGDSETRAARSRFFQAACGSTLVTTGSACVSTVIGGLVGAGAGSAMSAASGAIGAAVIHASGANRYNILDAANSCAIGGGLVGGTLGASLMCLLGAGAGLACALSSSLCSEDSDCDSDASPAVVYPGIALCQIACCTLLLTAAQALNCVIGDLALHHGDNGPMSLANMASAGFIGSILLAQGLIVLTPILIAMVALALACCLAPIAALIDSGILDSRPASTPRP